MNILILVLLLGLVFTSSHTAMEYYNNYTESDIQVMDELITKLIQIDPKASELSFNIHDNSSYTINKKHVHICIKDKNGVYYDMNTLTHVGIHELAHVLNDEIGHTDKFHEIFLGLIKKATDMKLYDPSIPLPAVYCSHH